MKLMFFKREVLSAHVRQIFSAAAASYICRSIFGKVMPQGQAADDREPGMSELLDLLHILDHVTSSTLEFLKTSHLTYR